MLVSSPILFFVSETGAAAWALFDTSAVLARGVSHRTANMSAGGDIIRHSVPADHSCLFTSVAYLCQGSSGEVELRTAGRKLREVCAQAVLADTDPASRAIMLGHDSASPNPNPNPNPNANPNPDPNPDQARLGRGVRAVDPERDPLGRRAGGTLTLEA